MECKEFTFQSLDKINIHARKWLPEGDLKQRAAVQIAHGMAEHSGRYEGFAKFLTKQGLAVYANDHRGHGKTAGELEQIGYLAGENGWGLAVEDMHGLTDIIKKECPGTPVILLGHSMGSLLSRAYAQEYGGDIDGLMLSGTSGDRGLLIGLGILASKMEIIRIGRRGRSKLMDRLMFGSFNRRFRPNRTRFDWLSRDDDKVDEYVEDKFCGEVFTAGFYFDFLNGIKKLSRVENMKKTPKGLPIYIFSGEKDPVGRNTKGVLRICSDYKKIGIEDVSCRIYKGARHEMLNETNREEVYGGIIDWINSRGFLRVAGDTNTFKSQ